MDQQSSQELLIESKGAGFTMQLELLPYDVLRDILSRLSIKDVVRMSVLSREWRQQRICHPDLVLTKDTFGISTDMNTKRASRAAEFIANVDSVLRPLWSTCTTTTTTLDKFVVEFGLRRKNKYHIDKWVSFSIVSRAKHIAFHFTFDVDCFGPGCDQYKYVFPLCRLSGPSGSCVTSLILGYVWLKLPPSFCGIINLRKLTLNTVSISDDDLRCLLLSCALLESINIEWCDSLSSLLIGQELCRLQYLRVRHCELKMIELHAPNLTKFEFDDYVMQTVLSDSSKLSEAIFVSNLRVLDGYDDVLDYMFTELPTALPHVHTLLLLLTVNQVERFSNTRDCFMTLRHLNMNLDIFLGPYDDSWVMGFVNLLELAPLLEELELHMDRDRFCFENPRTVLAAQGPPHRHLRSVYMSGFCDVLGLAELALYILRNATVLQRMVVDPVAGMMDNALTERFCSVRNGGSSEEIVFPTDGTQKCVGKKRMFAKNNLDKEEFCHVLTIL
ncbi:hypothetical protein CFC21_026741 [Triticum aestivum]|uniref:F-box domain-containing protein n=2 Tax=Triticum aestivum TaxID=4565 RepID=A0A3B6CH93_WHEAT|nr:hypothetical protein CFC21_026741 [Triticum aestivum]